MPNVIEVVDKEVFLPYLVNSFDMNIYILHLGVSAVVISNTYDKDGRQLYNKQFIIEGSEYDAWGTDDNYIKELVASKLGLEIKPVPIEQSDSSSV
jgi:hypothetical protein